MEEKEVKELFRYLAWIDKEKEFNKITIENTELKSNLDLQIKEAKKYRLRINKYLYYFSLFNYLENNKIKIDLKYFAVYEKGVYLFYAKELMSEAVHEILDKNYLYDDFELSDEDKDLLEKISFYFSDVNDEELVDLNHDDPLWGNQWGYKIGISNEKDCYNKYAKTKDMLPAFENIDINLRNYLKNFYEWTFREIKQ
ncbi:hypothetical protein SCHIN_v1c01010 [Spiroplasma chinense]|uniref:Uncharacterized protein n=1 Tax=Spiroplasma chinense TaxID=216932 RepID=A0A5B9Y3P5_9MOLU|nr:hypothetical protein [Spiroplasma chinense]QEH61299.1 hypothetical protein SCHIN_v1c01010 [Spiroplasma chinense]